ncbi:zinc finger and SCAN domain-containing protein 12-like isoform X3 [Periplaneta americana]|uniref:zinc finger and SCAN domain-containing protein 12-like isoform X3 n=1 Tax=Periplaneta americana TaxID=6978 RepID=UPI0037E71E7A
MVDILSVVMDDIKVKPEIDPLALPKEDTNIEECLPTEGNSLLQSVVGIKVEYEDSNNPYSMVTPERSPVPFSLYAVKCEPEEESCDVDIVKEEMLDLKTEDDDTPNRPMETEFHNDMTVEDGNNFKISVHESDIYRHTEIGSPNTDDVCSLPENTSPQRHLDLEFKFPGKDDISRSIIQNEHSDLKHSLDNQNYTHTNQIEYKCDICDKSFGHKQTLKTHEFIHTGEKPHKCHICEKSFRRSRILKLIH